MNDLNDIINETHIRIILKNYNGEEQLFKLRDYLFPLTGELKEIGVDPSRLAWLIYTTNKGKDD